MATQRRASYGPASPAVGERGARTRQRILDAMLALLGERGYHRVLVDDIAGALGLSRATLYQYFESREEIFAELLAEATDDLLRVASRLGPLSPTQAGYDNLHWWLGEWAWVYDKHATVFVQWAQLHAVESVFEPQAVVFTEAYRERMASRLREAGVPGFDPDDLVVALLVVINRVNYYRHVGGSRGLSDNDVLDTVATCLQLVLFPETPPGALRHTDGAAPGARSVNAPRPRRVGLAVAPDTSRPMRAEPSARAAATVERLERAGAQVFAEQGYHRATVEDVVTTAGVGRGTFYKYFDDKLDLLLTLAAECAGQLSALVSRFEALDGDLELREWLADVAQFHATFIGVFRLWFERDGIHPVLEQLGRTVELQSVHAFDNVFDRVERPYPFEVKAGSLIMLALIDQMPKGSAARVRPLTAGEQADLLTGIMERGLLNPGTTAASQSR